MAVTRSAASALAVAAAGLWLVELLKPLSVSTQVEMHLVLAAGGVGLLVLSLVRGEAGERRYPWAALLGGWLGLGLGIWAYVHLSGAVPYAWALALVAAAASWAAIWTLAGRR